MFILCLMFFTHVLTCNLYASQQAPAYQTDIKKAPPVIHQSTQTITRRLIDLTLEQVDAKSPIQRSKHTLDYKNDSMITDNVYGAGL